SGLRHLPCFERSLVRLILCLIEHTPNRLHQRLEVRDEGNHLRVRRKLGEVVSRCAQRARRGAESVYAPIAGIQSCALDLLLRLLEALAGAQSSKSDLAGNDVTQRTHLP